MKAKQASKRRDRRKANAMLRRGLVREPQKRKGHHLHHGVNQVVREPEPLTPWEERRRDRAPTTSTWDLRTPLADFFDNCIDGWVVAKSGNALASGARDRRFESARPNHFGYNLRVLHPDELAAKWTASDGYLLNLLQAALEWLGGSVNDPKWRAMILITNHEGKMKVIANAPEETIAQAMREFLGEVPEPPVEPPPEELVGLS